MGKSPQSDVTLLEDIEALPPSAKLVVKTLQYEGSLTSKELVEETRLPSRTVRHATGILEEDGIITSDISFFDARQRVYSLATPSDE